jgi:cyclophilin family peptidyl-prolyl cis-trans isomerase
VTTPNDAFKFAAYDKSMRKLVGLAICVCATAAAQDGVFAEIRTSKGLIVARLETELAPMTVANFVGLAEGTIDNAAFPAGRPFFDGSIWHRVVPGHVIQTGAAQSEKSRGPGYQFPNEINAKLSHNHAGVLNMANGGPNTNASQWCITLSDRSYLDGDFSVFGEVVRGLDVVMKIVQGDVVESVRIVRVGERAQAFHPTTASFQAMVAEANTRVAEHVEKKRAAEKEWLAKNAPKAEVLSSPAGEIAIGGVVKARYRATMLRYEGHWIGREGPPIVATTFVSGPDGKPALLEAPQEFAMEVGKTKINPGLDRVISSMKAGEKKTVAVPAELAYGRAGFYAPDVPGKKRLVVSSGTMVVYEVELLP